MIHKADQQPKVVDDKSGCLNISEIDDFPPLSSEGSILTNKNFQIQEQYSSFSRSSSQISPSSPVVADNTNIQNPQSIYDQTKDWIEYLTQLCRLQEANVIRGFPINYVHSEEINFDILCAIYQETFFRGHPDYF